MVDLVRQQVRADDGVHVDVDVDVDVDGGGGRDEGQVTARGSEGVSERDEQREGVLKRFHLTRWSMSPASPQWGRN